jgi:hypothetical protein
MNKILLNLIICLFLTPFTINAAVFSIDTKQNASLWEEVLVEVFADAENDSINTLSGVVTVYPKEVAVSKIQNGDSVINLWVESPFFDSKTNSIAFSGLTPGGFTGKRLVFSFVVKSEESIPIVVDIKEVLALKNDGNGTEAKVKTKNSKIVISSTTDNSVVSFTDITPPEEFVPVLGYSQDVFDGKAFVSFIAQDKGSGIDHYEFTYAYFWPSSDGWKPTTGSFEIGKEGLSKKIFIKAVDRLGNERVVSVVGPSYYQTLSLWVILIILFICVLFFTRRYFSSHS